ncbi:MAG: tRNA uridine-5-carboxymethylaminomethyl(34) synthesis GTPase MnmE [Sulfurospirillum sp.]|nr:MAG: tRNA uridine-5-carboxymethylaminomethyl(34) synthesis GTPase MnmE [Sulfurospirillum sp.]
MDSDTIVAIATAHGVGGISIVRVSGENALKISSKLISNKKLTPRVATLCNLTYNSTFIDEAIVIYFQAPKSFTGEDIIEFQCHGGSIVASMIVEALMNEGARVARAGEFTKRAVLNSKMDMSKAEAMAALIESKSKDQAQILAKQLKGELGEFVQSIRHSLVEVLAHIEVLIDYAEEDLDPNLQENIMQKLDENIDLISKILNSSKAREGILEGFKVSIIGKPNVGKSSLLNSLLSYNRAIISDIEGTTRDTVEEEIKIGTHLVKIVDTAGIRDASDEIEKIGIDRSMQAVDESQIVIALFDGSRDFDKNDQAILDLIKDKKESKKIFLFITKADLKQVMDRSFLKDYNYDLISKGQTDLVIKRVKEYLDSNSFSDDLILINKRQIDTTQNAFDSLQRAKKRLSEGELELFAYELNEAIQDISAITKPFERDEILDHMFSSFCLGK